MRICKCIAVAKLMMCMLLVGGNLMFVVCYFSLPVRNYRIPKQHKSQKLMQRPANNKSMEQHRNIIYNFYDSRKDWVTSNLGTYLFKPGISSNEVVPKLNRQGVFNVLIWKYWHWLKHRHAYSFLHIQNIKKIDPLFGCSVSNCRFSGNFDFASADAVLVHLQHGLLPKVTNRNPVQLWIFWTDESPMNAFTLSKKKPNLTELANIFNWSMTYRTDSDVPIPYGRTLPLPYPKVYNVTDDLLKELVPYWKMKRSRVLVAALMSNCYLPRLYFIEELNKYLKVDLYGKCASDKHKKRRCPGHFRTDCKVMSRYLFYIGAENSNCRQYITEKSFHHAYSKGAIPVIIGPPLEDCNTLLPPNSFLHVANFETPKHLALEIIGISKNVTKLLSYHLWRKHFEVVNEHGYFGRKSSQLCRICEALNYNERSQKVYGLVDIRRYLDPDLCCTSFWKAAI